MVCWIMGVSNVRLGMYRVTDYLGEGCWIIELWGN